jgi:hypothetical protein
MDAEHAINEETLFIQTAIQLARQHEVSIDFSQPQIMNFIGDRGKCIECIDELASLFPNRIEA